MQKWYDLKDVISNVRFVFLSVK